MDKYRMYMHSTILESIIIIGGLKMKKLFMMAVLVLTMFLLTGCYEENMSVKVNSNGTASVTKSFLIHEDLYGEYVFEEDFEDGVIIKDIVIDGEKYKDISQTVTAKLSETANLIKGEDDSVFTSVKLTAVSFEGMLTAFLTDDIIASYKEMEGDNLADYIKCKLTIEFPDAITKTNGSLDSTKKIVTWDLASYRKDTKLYAQCGADVKITGVAAGKIYKKAVTVKFSSSDGIKSATLNKKSIKTGKKVSKDGKYTLVVTSNKAIKKTVKFTVDKTKPVIKGAKANKIYKKAVTLKFSDKTSGINTVKVNGKKISAKKYKNGYKIKKVGKYTVTVTDKAGNTKKIKFEIKK